MIVILSPPYKAMRYANAGHSNSDTAEAREMLTSETAIHWRTAHTRSQRSDSLED